MARQRQRLVRWADRYEKARWRHWDLEGEPGPILRWCADRPVVTTILLTVVLTGALGATFGIPPLSPLFLVVAVVATVAWWLRGERTRIGRWEQQRRG